MSRRDDKPPNNPKYVITVEDSGDLLTINQQVQIQNTIFYQLLSKKHPNNHTRLKFLPFFDLYNMSFPVHQPWYMDHIHCYGYFYNALQDALFETFCNSLINST